MKQSNEVIERAQNRAKQSREVSASAQGSRPEAVAAILPPVDIYEDDAGIIVLADMPGVSKEQLGVRVTGDNLVIEGTVTAPVSGDMELLYGEVLNSQYRRSFTLSRELDPGKIEAKLANGVLRVSIPKAKEAKSHRIEVSVA